MPGTVEHYYDSNTQDFLRYGGSGDLAAIHRAIWAPGVRTRAGAFLYLNRLAAETILSWDGSPNRLIDLGCGAGGTATWLAQQYGASVTGVTVSQVQADIANQRAEKAGLTRSCRFIQADFHALPGDLGLYDGAYAIEAFAHSHNPSAFFEQAADHLCPGARLFIADDFLSPQAPPSNRWIEQVRRGWHLANLNRVTDALPLAEKAGFRLLADRDLSPFLRHWPLLWLGLALQLSRLSIGTPGWQNFSGGVALQHCFRRGWTVYHSLVFEKV